MAVNSEHAEGPSRAERALLLCDDRLVEVAGIEPASSGGLTGLLRAQSAIPLLDPTGHTDKPV